MNALISIQEVTKTYEKHKALDNVSMDIPQGKVFGLLGPNGAGKTSLIRIITQITGADSGRVLFNGELLARHHISNIGYLPEERGLYKKMKVGEQLIYLAQLKGMDKGLALKRLKEWFEKLEMIGWWHKNVEELSKGMQQKVQFVATVVHEPDLIILDEPFTGFDPINANLIKDEILKLKAKGATIIFSTHRMEQVEELCDNIGLINKSKKIIDGQVQSVKEQFAQPNFKVEVSGAAPTDTEVFKVLKSEDLGQLKFKSILEVSTLAKGNEVLQGLMAQGLDVQRFEPAQPSINEIFISLVKAAGQTIEETV